MEVTLKDRIGQYVDENIIRSFLGMEKIKYSTLNDLFKDSGLIYEIPQYKEICSTWMHIASFLVCSVNLNT